MKPFIQPAFPRVIVLLSFLERAGYANSANSPTEEKEVSQATARSLLKIFHYRRFGGEKALQPPLTP
jgi:hypothetical protein